ncbi:MAG: HlyD family type I secretion periplasmic adaptor subunit [Pirellulaceae bacterium]
MVSADGSSITPDDPDQPADAKAEDQENGNPVPTASSRLPKEETPVAPDDDAREVDEANEETPESGDGSGETTDEQAAPPAAVPATQTPKKPKKLSRKKSRIGRLVMEFQPDAVEMEHRKVAGGLRWTLYTVILLLISTVAWATWARVDRVVVSEGKLIADEAVLIKAPATSTTLTIEVEFGDTVEAGQVLVTLDESFSEAEVAKLEGRSNSLLAKMQRLAAEQSKGDFVIPAQHGADEVWLTERKAFIDRRAEMSAKMDEFDADHRKLVAQQNKNAAEIRSLGNRVRLRTQLLEQVKELRITRAVSVNEVIQNQIELDYAESLLITAESQTTEIEADFVTLEKRKDYFNAERQAAVSLELSQIRQQYNEAVEDLNMAVRADEKMVLRAPLDFPEYKVVEIADFSSTVQPGEPLMKLVPKDSPLELEVKVDAQHIARIREAVADAQNTEGADGIPNGAAVRIKLSAYPYMKHGTLDGVVKTISEDVTEEGQPPMIRSYYIVRVQLLDTSELRDVPDDQRLLQPGMAATADIKVGTRRVIDYFIYPLFRSVDSSIREP